MVGIDHHVDAGAVALDGPAAAADLTCAADADLACRALKPAESAVGRIDGEVDARAVARCGP
jgi:hypothetical protein